MTVPVKKPDRTTELARLFGEASRMFGEGARIFADISTLLGGTPPAAGRGAAKKGGAARGPAAPPPADGTPASRNMATDRALDAANGDPTVKFSPRRWEGDSFNGCPYSECPADFLEILGEALAYSATHPKVGKENFAAENARCSSLAYGWAARKRQSGGGDTGGGEPSGPGGGEDPGAGKESW